MNPPPDQEAAPSPSPLDELAPYWPQSRLVRCPLYDDRIPQALRLGMVPVAASFAAKVVCVECTGRCGSPAAIVLWNDKAGEDFLKANPKLKGTLMVKVWDARVLWLIAEPAPRNFSSEAIGWVSQGLVPLHELGQPRVDLWPGTGITRLNFVDLAWLPGERAQADAVLREAVYGPPFHVSRRQQQVLNPLFWASRLGSDLGIRYSAAAGAFQTFESRDGGWKVATRESVMSLVAMGLNTAARNLTEFPVEQIRASRLRQIVDAMTINCCTDAEETAGVLEEFVDSVIRISPGDTVTTGELWDACREFARARRLTALNKEEFERRIGRLIRARFGRNRSHGIHRPEGWHRGFHNLALHPAADATDGNGRDGRGQESGQVDPSGNSGASIDRRTEQPDEMAMTPLNPP